MDRWWSQPYCARAVHSFNLMPWQYKALDLSEILVPVLFTWVAYVEAKFAAQIGSTQSIWFWEAFNILAWCWYAARLFLFVRGQQALRKGIKPTLDVKFDGPKKGQYGLTATSILFGLLILLFLVTYFLTPSLKRSASDLAMPCFFLAMFWQQVVKYFRGRFLKASLNRAT